MLSQSPRSTSMSVYALMQPHSSDDSPQFFRQLVQDHFENALTTLPTREDHTEVGLITDLGDMIIHLLSMVSQLADDIIDDKLIKQRAYGAMTQEEKGVGRRYTLAMSLQDADASHKVLKDMRATLKSTVSTFSQVWQMSTGLPPPVNHARPVSLSLSVTEHTPSPNSTLSPSSGGPSVHDLHKEPGSETQQTDQTDQTDHTDQTEQTDETDQTEQTESPDIHMTDKPSPTSETGPFGVLRDSEPCTEKRVSPDPELDHLRNRGKGTYTCKYAMACTKGGVDANGQLVVFERNCMFRQHMDKHKKPYKCIKAGCPNKEGFARKDQLERHMHNVKHDVP